MSMVLKPVELRVLGVLIEKSISQPAYYPMTLNAITAACNQKTNRDPVMACAEGEVGAALHELTRWQLVSQADPDRGSRANRFRHEVEKRLGWSTPQRAVMAELLVRGPQTVGELRTNASRLVRFDSVEYVRQILGELEQSDPRWVVELPRQPGKSSTRFAHLMAGEAPVDVAATTIGPQEVAQPDRRISLETQLADLTGRVERIERWISERGGPTA